MRVLIHAGFHKTGTTSLQAYLRLMRDRLKPYADIYLKEDFLVAGRLGRRFSLHPYLRRRLKFRGAFRAFLESIQPAENIVMSWESFSGAIPGFRRIDGGIIENYSRAAIPLATEIINELKHRFGDDIDIEFIYTTRATDSWIKSAFGHLASFVRVPETLEKFKEMFTDIPDLEVEAANIRRALSPVVVHSRSLEDYGALRFGMASIIFELLNIPEGSLSAFPKAERRNSGPSAQILEKYCALNASVKDPEELSARKKLFLAELKAKRQKHNKNR